jgi:hypothetical protein
MHGLQTSSTSTDINPQLRVFVKALFEDMLLSFGKKFTDQWEAADTERMEMHWCKHLTGFTPREFKRGIAAMENLAWPPSLPEFKKLCRPPIDSVVAYYEAIAGVQARERGEAGAWSHPAIYFAAMPLSFDLTHQTFSAIKTRWEKALSAELEKGKWAEIPKPMLAIDYQKSEMSKEKAEAFLESAGLKKVSQQKDHLAWAHQIVEHHKNKTRTYPAISIQFAREVLAGKE